MRPRPRMRTDAAGQESVVDATTVVRGLAASSNLSSESGHPGKDIKPCIAAIIETQLVKGDFPNRNQAAVIISSELQRIGLDYDSVCERLKYWNLGNTPPLKPNELQKATDNGYSGKYNYGCKHPVLESFCAGDMCQFVKHVLSKRRKVSNYVFLDYGWQRYLSNRQVLIYQSAIPYLEIKRRVGPGGLVCANHKQIAEACGISPKRIGHDLRVLAAAGLIEYTPGQPKKWLGLASEIRRVIPIPRPTSDIIQRIKNGKSLRL